MKRPRAAKSLQKAQFAAMHKAINDAMANISSVKDALENNDPSIIMPSSEIQAIVKKLISQGVSNTVDTQPESHCTITFDNHKTVVLTGVHNTELCKQVAHGIGVQSTASGDVPASIMSNAPPDSASEQVIN